MPKILLYIIITVAVALLIFIFFHKEHYPSDEKTVMQGKEIFTKYCLSCHGLKAEGFGPPLGGITRILSENELKALIKNPSKAIEVTSSRAARQYARYKQVMPSFDWMKDEEVTSVLSYIHQQTELNDINPVSVKADTTAAAFTGRLIPPIKKSGLKIELEDVIQIPHLPGTTTDLGIVTLRPHPSGDGTLLVSDQNGIIYIIDGNRASIFLNICDYVKDFQNGPGIATGIGSFDFHPDFLNNGLLYILHAETYKGQKADYAIVTDSLKSVVQWVLSEWKMNHANDRAFSGTYRELLRLHAPNFAHGAQDLSFIPGLEKNDPEYGLLYFGYGDGGSNNIKHPELGHHLKSFLGSILRIDPSGHNSKNGNYGIPATNPFVNETDPGVVKEIYAFGFRNPHRLAWDKPNHNRMMATDIGESNIEELNIIEKGGDYGWPSREGNFGINTKKDPKTVYKISEPDLDLYKKPFVVYDHEEGNAISGGYVYEGDLTALKDKYIFGDIVNGRLFYVNVNPALSDSTIHELTIVRDGKETSLKEMSNTKRLHLRIAYDRRTGNMYVISKMDGMIRRIVKAYN
ncbi:MAG TPA: PQQ-dependent sugar dehydrogenase [Cyclobacteriaceae bacterium]|nr:PQQ-dependent sugar dehydrogenase [Cyclobacteriaceae bacterium]